jgi:hypothetical protein
MFLFCSVAKSDQSQDCWRDDKGEQSAYIQQLKQELARIIQACGILKKPLCISSSLQKPDNFFSFMGATPKRLKIWQSCCFQANLPDGLLGLNRSYVRPSPNTQRE